MKLFIARVLNYSEVVLRRVGGSSYGHSLRMQLRSFRNAGDIRDVWGVNMGDRLETFNSCETPASPSMPPARLARRSGPMNLNVKPGECNGEVVNSGASCIIPGAGIAERRRCNSSSATSIPSRSWVIDFSDVCC